MFFSHSTRNGNFWALHETRKEAVQHLIDSLNGDYQDDFWISIMSDGEHICTTYKCDFNLSIYNSYEKAVESLKDIDAESIQQNLILITDAIKKSIKDGDRKGVSIILSAVCSGNIELVKLVLSQGADVNDAEPDGWTPLHEAAWGGYKDIASLLIERGADVNAADCYGNNALFSAVLRGHKDIAALLISNGAVVSNKEELLNIALGHDKPELAAFLDAEISKQIKVD